MTDVIIPVLDEAGALPWVLSRMPGGFRPLVVDNGSRDGSAAVARRFGARVVTEPVRGFGAACFTGLLAADSELVCFMDGDGSLDPEDLPRVAEPVRSGAVDLVVGSRVALSGAWPLHARLGNRALAAMVRRRGGLRQPMRDLGPMRAARRGPLLALGLRDRRFGWPLEMVVRALDEGWSVRSVPVVYRPRAGGRSKVTGSVIGTARAIRDSAAVLR